MRVPVIPAPPARPRPTPRDARPKDWEALIVGTLTAILLVIGLALMAAR